MMTIDVDEQTHSRLESKARERGLALPEYLKWIADGESMPPVEVDDARQEVLRERMRKLIEESENLEPQPTKLLGTAGAFADALVEKYRGH